MQMGESDDGESADVLHLISSFLGTGTKLSSMNASASAIGPTRDLVGGTEEVSAIETIHREETLIDRVTETKVAPAAAHDGDGKGDADEIITLDFTREDNKRTSIRISVSPITIIDRVVIFSKDRPWQLQQLLRSIFGAFSFPQSNPQQYQNQQYSLQICIIVNVTNLFRDGYEKVKKEYDTIVEEIRMKLLKGTDVSIVWMYESMTNSNGVEDSYQHEKQSDHIDVEERQTQEQQKNHSFARLLEEAVGYSFGNRIDSKDDELKNSNDDGNEPSVLIMFITDDCILLEPLLEIFSTCRDVSQHYDQSYDKSDDLLFGFLTRLHPGITYSQTRDEASPPPPTSYFTYHQSSRSMSSSSLSSTRNHHNVDGGLDAFVYPKHIASLSSSRSCEFAYSFDLSGGIYHQKMVVKVLTMIRERQRGGGMSYYSHPNIFEIQANNVLQTAIETDVSWKKNLLLSIPARPSLLILAINRVQDVYKAPIAIAKTEPDDDYNEENSGATVTSCTPENLLKYFFQGRRLDLNRYKARMFQASHIGSIFLESDGGCTSSTSTRDFSFSDPEKGVDKIEDAPETDTSIDESYHHDCRSDDISKHSLSVLIPIHNGPPPAASLALKSVLYQVVTDNDDQDDKDSKKIISKMQVIIVEDRCTDGSVNAMLQTAEQICTEFYQKGIIANRIVIRDHRSWTGSTSTGICTSPLHPIMDVPREDIYIDLVSSPSRGVGAALNHGLRLCHYEFVARMDADDISCPGRFMCQMRYLHHHKSVKVLGTHSIIFSDASHETSRRSKGVDSIDDRCSDDVEKNSSGSTLPNTIGLPYSHELHNVIRCSLEPTDAGFVAWCMLFSCVIVHPSVMMRKSSVLGVGGYACEYEERIQDIGCSVTITEDYDLWLRLSHENIRSLCSIPRVGVYHRKHASRSQDDQRARKQRDESINLSLHAISKLVGGNRHLSFEIVEALKHPDSSKCVDASNGAAALLCQVEVAFIAKYKYSLTNNEMKLVELDCNERIGELATTAFQKFGRTATQGSAWGKWCERCPHHQLEQIALLCHAVN